MGTRIVLLLLVVMVNPTFAEISIGGCPKLTLTVSSLPSDQLQVEYWDINQGTWVASEQPLKGRRTQVEPGHLYRTRTCATGGLCSSSDVIWAPLFLCPSDRPAGTEKILELIEVKDPQGNHLATGSANSPTESLESQFIDYNILTSVQHFHSMEEKVAMQKPAYVKDWTKATYEELINIYVYIYYETERLRGDPDLTGTGFSTHP